MVEVFKTNVTNNHHARTLVEIIESRFKEYRVNFDLDDCDRILRIESSRVIDPEPVIVLLGDLGVNAEVLTDEPVLLIIS
jgi:hypothetical protein